VSVLHMDVRIVIMSCIVLTETLCKFLNLFREGLGTHTIVYEATEGT
jgi:hypothetical protein